MGLYRSDPKARNGGDSDGDLIGEGRAEDTDLLRYAGVPGKFGRGGMVTKVQAAQKAARSGATTVIANGRTQDTLLRIRGGESIGTLLLPGTERIAARKQWLAGQLRGNGELVLDDGATRVLRESGKSLIAHWRGQGKWRIPPRRYSYLR